MSRSGIAAIGLLFFSVLTTFAEEPSAASVDENVLNRQLLERIAQLERRVAELEAKLSQPYRPAPRAYTPGEPQRDVPSAPHDAPSFPYAPTSPAPPSMRPRPGRTTSEWPSSLRTAARL